MKNIDYRHSHTHRFGEKRMYINDLHIYHNTKILSGWRVDRINIYIRLTADDSYYNKC